MTGSFPVKSSNHFLQYFFYSALGSIIIISSLLNVVLFVNLFSLIFVFAVSQILHEYGHYLSHHWNKRNPIIHYMRIIFLKIPVKVSAMDLAERPFTSWELTRASLFGIVAGAIPINIYFYITGNIFGLLILQAFYIYASRFDIKDIRNYLHNFYIDSRRSKEGL